jgi:hypothetical protein
LKKDKKTLKTSKRVSQSFFLIYLGDFSKDTLPPPISEGSRLGFDANLCYIEGAEYSFEENRAALCHSSVENNTDNSENLFFIDESMDLVQMAIDNTPQKPGIRQTSSTTASPWHPPPNPDESISSTPRAEGPIEDIFKMFDNGSTTDSPVPVKSAMHIDMPLVQSSSKAKPAERAFSELFVEELDYEDEEEEPVDPNVIVYNPEDDETISKQVYKRPEAVSFKLGVFHDEEDTEGSLAVESTPVARSARLFNPVHVMTPVTERSDRTHHTIANSLMQTELPIEELEETNNSSIVSTSLFTNIKKSPSVVSVCNPCNPSESKVRQAVLSLVKPPPESKIYMYPSRNSTLGSRLLMAIKNSEMSVIDDEFIVFIEEIDEESFTIQRPGRKQSVFKILSPPSIWEYYILFLVQSKIPKLLKNCVISPYCCYLFQNESILEMECAGTESLLDVVSKAKSNSKLTTDGLDEMIVAYFTLQILTILDALHSTGIVHGDLRIGNFMVRSLSESFNDFDVTGSQGWTNFALCLKDWSASINLNAFPVGQKFQIEPSLEQADSGECWEFRNGKEWTFEPDWYGASGIIHILIFGELIETNMYETSGSGQRPKFSLEQQVDDSWTSDSALWKDTFDTLLNLSHTSIQANPLKELCSRIESHLLKFEKSEILACLKKL